MSRLRNLVERMKVKIGIITVPEESAQEVANLMVAAGIKAIWNFAPLHLKVPEGIVVRNENLAVSLSLLSIQLKSEEE